MKRSKNKSDWVDDGRTIADMNVEGMPWYNPARKTISQHEKKEAGTPLGIKETISMTKGVLLAALIVTSVFIVSFFLFILFCTNVWLR